MIAYLAKFVTSWNSFYMKNINSWIILEGCFYLICMWKIPRNLVQTGTGRPWIWQKKLAALKGLILAEASPRTLWDHRKAPPRGNKFLGTSQMWIGILGKHWWLLNRQIGMCWEWWQWGACYLSSACLPSLSAIQGPYLCISEVAYNRRERLTKQIKECLISDAQSMWYWLMSEKGINYEKRFLFCFVFQVLQFQFMFSFYDFLIIISSHTFRLGWGYCSMKCYGK